MLDYDDLIDRTLDLFRRTSAAWVLYKLDLGIDHVLLDEAQDTSPKQWEIVQTLVGEFVAGAGARGPKKRTLFAVGDDKQSIFSFQGAAPEKFAAMRRDFEGAIQGRRARMAQCAAAHFLPVERNRARGRRHGVRARDRFSRAFFRSDADRARASARRAAGQCRNLAAGGRRSETRRRRLGRALRPFERDLAAGAAGETDCTPYRLSGAARAAGRAMC